MAIVYHVVYADDKGLYTKDFPDPNGNYSINYFGGRLKDSITELNAEFVRLLNSGAKVVRISRSKFDEYR